MKFLLKNSSIQEIGSLSKKYSSQTIDPDTLKAKSQRLEYVDEFTNIGEEILDLKFKNNKIPQPKSRRRNTKVCFRGFKFIKISFYSTNLNPLSSSF